MKVGNKCKISEECLQNIPARQKNTGTWVVNTVIEVYDTISGYAICVVITDS